MNIRYNEAMRRFEAEFTSDFAGDLATVKGAGFKTDGPPVWIWWTAKIPVLDKLRANKPVSGLTITDAAFEVYKVLAEREQKNAEAKAAFQKVDKEAKKERKKKEQEEATTKLFNIPEGQIWIGPEDLPPKPPFVSELSTPKPPGGPWCYLCGAPVYFYETQEPLPVCLWCEMHPVKISS